MNVNRDVWLAAKPAPSLDRAAVGVGAGVEVQPEAAGFAPEDVVRVR